MDKLSNSMKYLFRILLVCFCAFHANGQNSTNEVLYTNQLYVNKILWSNLSHDNLKDSFVTQTSTYQKDLNQPYSVLRIEKNRFEFESEDMRLTKFDLFTNLCELKLKNQNIRIGDSIDSLVKVYKQSYLENKAYRSMVFPIHDLNGYIGKLYVKYNREEKIASLHYYSR